MVSDEICWLSLKFNFDSTMAVFCMLICAVCVEMSARDSVHFWASQDTMIMW